VIRVRARRPLAACAFVAAAFAALLGIASPAWAEAGSGPITTLTAGPYIVVPYDAGRGLTPDSQRYPITVYDAPNHKATDVTVSLTAADAKGRTVGPLQAEVAANGFQAVLPPAPPEGWTVTVTVSGPMGSGTASYRVHGIPQASPTSGSAVFLKIVVATFGLTILTVLVVLLVHARRRQDAELDALI
jgi:hypothetical protein